MVVGRDSAASFTGSKCLDWASGTTGPGYAAQGNVLVSGETVAGLGGGFEGSAGRPAGPSGSLPGSPRHRPQAARAGIISSVSVVRREGGAAAGGRTWPSISASTTIPSRSPSSERLFEQHELLFGQTPAEEWVAVDEKAAGEIRQRLAALGYVEENLERAFNAWVGTENLEERMKRVDRVDPVILEALRKA